ncbi:protein-disulfide reductase DsbD [Halomonas binhaiensis]|uniref:Thiol:disulfide interchange protein DsbD n=1 Tax=Halomonas binhaiensis TaxID=2562282 RepID=A0A5C1NIB3_9GAMM|nr:protein-disulfide reductase DsbD [Halomonas binhaiensis]QEM81479.1 protein-disulfide reductase DsbD [Halomonas binhaiensis]
MPFVIRLLALCCLILLPFTAQAQFFSSSSNSSEFLPVDQAFFPNAWHDGEHLYIGFENADGYYLYRHRFSVSAPDAPDMLGEPQLPPGEAKTDEFFGDVFVFYDKMVFAVPFTTPQQGPVNIDLTFQGCADAGLCYPPETVHLEAPQASAPSQFAADVEALMADIDNATENSAKDKDAQGDTQASNSSTPSTDSAATSNPGSRSTVAKDPSTTEIAVPLSEDSHFSTLMRDTSVPLMLGLFFLAGLGLTFTPCVLPMLPILSSIIVGQNPTRGRALALSGSYVAGMALTYALIGVLMGLFGAGLNLQARLQSAPVLILFAILFTLFALAMFGVFNLSLSSRLGSRIDAWQTRAQQSGPVGLAVAGALSVLVVSPCVSAPLAGALVFISTTGDALVGGAALLALALGMGVPLLLVGGFGTTLLPRSGAWMNGIKIAFGILLLGVAIWLIERLLPSQISLLLWAGLAIGTALALGALNLSASAGWSRVRQGAGIMLLVWGIALVIGAARGASDPLRPLAMTSAVAGATQAGTPVAPVTVVRSLDELHSALAKDSSPAIVNVTAEWCISCKVMERDVFPSPDVQQALANYRWIEADVTSSNATSRELLQELRLFGPPSLLFFDGSDEISAARIQGEVTADQLTRHVNQVNQWLAENAQE